MALSAAERLLQSFGVEEPEEIDLEGIAWRLGAIVKRRPLDGCEATIVGNSRNAVICVNCLSIPARQRFSIGHELGHWRLHKGRVLFCSGRDIDRPMAGALGPEQQADAFASDLLLQGEPISNAVQAGGLGPIPHHDCSPWTDRPDLVLATESRSRLLVSSPGSRLRKSGLRSSLQGRQRGHVPAQGGR